VLLLNKYKIEEFLQDPGSTTGYFSQLSHEYRLEILKHGINGDSFERIIAIYLNNIPCMLAISKTSLSFPLFLDILQNAGQIPIGTRLFAPDSSIIRANLQISLIDKKKIDNPIIARFIEDVKYEGAQLYSRMSDFVFEEQFMHLDEYALPGLVDILNDTKI